MIDTEIILQIVLLSITLLAAAIALRKIFTSFEKGSMIGDIMHGFVKYVIITVLLEVSFSMVWIYNKFVYNIALQPKYAAEIAFQILLTLSYAVLYMTVAHYKQREEKEFGKTVSEKDIVEYGFVKTDVPAKKESARKGRNGSVEFLSQKQNK